VLSNTGTGTVLCSVFPATLLLQLKKSLLDIPCDDGKTILHYDDDKKWLRI
jgi:hypothetical protein